LVLSRSNLIDSNEYQRDGLVPGRWPTIYPLPDAAHYIICTTPFYNNYKQLPGATELLHVQMHFDPSASASLVVPVGGAGVYCSMYGQLAASLQFQVQLKWKTQNIEMDDYSPHFAEDHSGIGIDEDGIPKPSTQRSGNRLPTEHAKRYWV